jgi:hypothetical protein
VGEHTGVPPVQAAAWLGRHCTQPFVAVSQIDAPVLVQLAFVKQHAGPGLGHTAAVDVDVETVVPVLPLPLGVEPVAVTLPLPLVPLPAPLPVLALPDTVLVPLPPPSGAKEGAELPPQPA